MEDEYKVDTEAQDVDKALKSRKRRLAVMIAIGVVAVFIIVALVVMLMSKGSQVSEKDAEIEQMQLKMEMMQSANQLDSIDRQFAQLEGNQVNLLANDSIVEKYTAAKAQIEKLMQELNNEKGRNAAKVAKLQSEIETLKGILRDYAQRINELMAENEGLREENNQVKDENRQLSNQVSQNRETIRQQSAQITLAKKLNVTGLSLTPLNKKGKNEKNITKATQLKVSFTVTENNTTEPGDKTVYVNIYQDGVLLPGNGTTFSFEGASLQASAKMHFDYANEEIGGLTVFYDVNTTLAPGQYRVELFCDGYRLDSRTFNFSK